MWNDSEAGKAARERLSALLDGELDRPAAREACTHWRENAETRTAWHAYHLIGDVLRSDDLACHPLRDAGFLVALRARLAAEPVVFSPAVVAAPAATGRSPEDESGAAPPRQYATATGGRRRQGWLATAAITAGFVAVGGVLVLTRSGAGLAPSSGDALVRATPGTALLAAGVAPPTPTLAPPAAATTRLASTAPPEPQTFVANRQLNGQLIRDARLDRYLAAHQQFAGSSALGVPSAYLRNAAVERAGR